MPQEEALTAKVQRSLARGHPQIQGHQRGEATFPAPPFPAHSQELGSTQGKKNQAFAPFGSPEKTAMLRPYVSRSYVSPGKTEPALTFMEGDLLCGSWTQAARTSFPGRHGSGPSSALPRKNRSVKGNSFSPGPGLGPHPGEADFTREPVPLAVSQTAAAGPPGRHCLSEVWRLSPKGPARPSPGLLSKGGHGQERNWLLSESVPSLGWV